MISDGAVHGLVHGCSGLHAEIAPVPVDRFSFLRKIDLAVVEGGRCRFDPSDELMVCIHENVYLVAEIRFRALLCPGTIAASPRFRLVSPRGIGTRMTGI